MNSMPDIIQQFEELQDQLQQIPNEGDDWYSIITYATASS